MSLDFSLVGPEKEVEVECRFCGHSQKEMQREEYFWSNITHNLNTMAQKAGIYEVLWRPDENGYKYGRDIIEPLKLGLFHLNARPEFFQKFNAENGWGTYENFVEFVREVLWACEEHPDAEIQVSR